LNQTCAFDAHFESILPGDTRKLFFDNRRIIANRHIICARRRKIPVHHNSDRNRPGSYGNLTGPLLLRFGNSLRRRIRLKCYDLASVAGFHEGEDDRCRRKIATRGNIDWLQIERPYGMVEIFWLAFCYSEIGLFGLRNREQVLPEMIPVVFGTDHLQERIRHLAPAPHHVEWFIESVGVFDLDEGL
jgi:hypothetical protein